MSDNRLRRLIALSALMAVPAGLAGQTTHDAAAHAAHHPATDSAFTAMKSRGMAVMGVDQEASVHHFDATDTGGRIRFTMKDTTDLAGTAVIRAHLRDIAAAFARGDFQQPAAVHETAVPGTAVMSAQRQALRYTVREVPGGGELTITASTPDTRAAVRDFLAFQSQDHRTDEAHTP